MKEERYYGTDIGKYSHGWRTKKEHGADLSGIGDEYDYCNNYICKKMTREKRIPFEVSVDPFYMECNMEHLRRGVEALNAGKGVEHDIIEVDE